MTLRSPCFELRLKNIKHYVIATAAATRTHKLLQAKFRWSIAYSRPNIAQAERSVLLWMKECKNRYNNSGKNLFNRGPVIYSKDLYA